MAWYVAISMIMTQNDNDLILNLSIWYGVQASIGGDCMKVMLRAIWPSVNDIRA